MNDTTIDSREFEAVKNFHKAVDCWMMNLDCWDEVISAWKNLGKVQYEIGDVARLVVR